MIAVTGSNGLLGAFVVKKFLQEGQSVIAIVRANSDMRSLNDAGEKIARKVADVLDVPALMASLEGVTTVIHTAAMVSFSKRKAKTIFDVNVQGTRNVVDACLTLGISRLIHVSSVAALGRVKGISEVTEESKWTDSPLNSDYAESKYRAELEVYRGMEEGLEVSLVNPSVILAPADWKKSSAQLFRYAWQQRPFYTDGSINYVDVRDVAEMIHKIWSTSVYGEKFIANAGTVTFKSFFEQVGKRMNRRPPFIKVDGKWVNVIARLEELRSRLTGTEPLVTSQSARMTRENFYYANQKARDVLGMKFTPLDETLEWCCAHYLGNVTINK